MCMLHAKGVVHADLTATNILLTPSDGVGEAAVPTVKICDFGVSVQLPAVSPEVMNSHGGRKAQVRVYPYRGGQRSLHSCVPRVHLRDHL